ncbi:hypothetical protein ACH4FX_24105 [Streptomyces sp. NPDC018019]|uniref:hypothetical protein n=1 Tax=Streptomyces sp. NPDC018019 TaxID=3365030 RepID=UPI0037B02E99
MTTAETGRADARSGGQPDGRPGGHPDGVRRPDDRPDEHRRSDARPGGPRRPDARPDDPRQPVTVRHRAALAATDAGQLTDAVQAFGAPDLVGAPEAHTKPVDAVTWALRTAFEALPEPVRPTTPLYVLCGAYSSWAARHFVRRCHDTERRLRPSDSIGLETSELVRPYTTASGHRGGCYLLAPLPVDAHESERAAGASGPARPPWPLAAMPGPAVHLDLFVSPASPAGGPRPAHCLAVATAWSVTCP